MQLTSVCLSHINTHMSTHTGCMCGRSAWCSKWSSQMLHDQPCSLTQVHVWVCVCLIHLELPCTAIHCCYVYIVCVYKLIVRLRGLPLSPTELSWELHVMSATFSPATMLPIMNRQGSVTREWAPARRRPRPNRYRPPLTFHFGPYRLFLHVRLLFCFAVYYLYLSARIWNNLSALSSSFLRIQ